MDNGGFTRTWEILRFPCIAPVGDGSRVTNSGRLFVCEGAAFKTITHKQGIAKRRRTKCGEMDRRKSECLNSTVEIGELYNPEESMEGSEASEF